MPGSDSFLDVVTNVVGVMLLIVVVTIVNANDMRVSLGTPVCHPAPKGAKRVLLECRGNRLVHLDEEKLDEALGKFLKEQETKRGEKVAAKDVPKLLDDNDVGNETHRVRTKHVDLAPFDYLTYIYEWRQEVRGESIAEFQEESSQYQSLLASLTTDRSYLFFIVRADSYEVFRAARRVARSRGFEAGWDPHGDKPLMFSPFGDTTDPQ
jgi:hypothetical protein